LSEDEDGDKHERSDKNAKNDTNRHGHHQTCSEQTHSAEKLSFNKAFIDSGLHPRYATNGEYIFWLVFVVEQNLVGIVESMLLRYPLVS